MKIPHLAGLFALLSAGCTPSPHPGYSTVADGVHLRLITLGEGEQLATDSDSVMMRFRVSLPGGDPGSLFSTDRSYAAGDLRSGALVPVLTRMHEGDSMSLIAPSHAFPWAAVAAGMLDVPPDSGLLQVELSLLRIRTPAMQRADRERMLAIDPEGYERALIARYIQRTGMPWTRWGTSDLHYRIEGEATDTNRVRKGEVVAIRYTGKRITDEVVIDDSGRTGHDLMFRFGDHDQVIEGVATAVHLLRRGQRGEFILPSAMAFGPRGVEGIIEPWTAVVYAVQLVPPDSTAGPVSAARR